MEQLWGLARKLTLRRVHNCRQQLLVDWLAFSRHKLLSTQRDVPLQPQRTLPAMSLQVNVALRKHCKVLLLILKLPHSPRATHQKVCHRPVQLINRNCVHSKNVFLLTTRIWLRKLLLIWKALNSVH